MGVELVVCAVYAVVDYHPEQYAPGHFPNGIAKFFDVREIFVQLKQGGCAQ